MSLMSNRTAESVKTNPETKPIPAPTAHVMETRLVGLWMVQYLSQTTTTRNPRKHPRIAPTIPARNLEVIVLSGQGIVAACGLLDLEEAAPILGNDAHFRAGTVEAIDCNRRLANFEFKRVRGVPVSDDGVYAAWGQVQFMCPWLQNQRLGALSTICDANRNSEIHESLVIAA